MPHYEIEVFQGASFPTPTNSPGAPLVEAGDYVEQGDDGKLDFDNARRSWSYFPVALESDRADEDHDHPDDELHIVAVTHSMYRVVRTMRNYSVEFDAGGLQEFRVLGDELLDGSLVPAVWIVHLRPSNESCQGNYPFTVEGIV